MKNPQDEELIKAMLAYPNYMVRCKASHKKPNDGECSGKIREIYLAHESETIFVYFLTWTATA